MKKYALWVKCLVFFLAVVTLLGVAVSGLGILLAESMNMYTRDDYGQWLYDRYYDRADVIASQVLLDYGGSLSDCPQWLLEESGHANAITRVKNWFELSESDWCYSIQKDGKAIRSNRNEALEKDALHFAFEKDFNYPFMGEGEEGFETVISPGTGEGIRIHYRYETGYQVDVWINWKHTGYYRDYGLSARAMQWLFAAKYPLIAIAAVSLLLFALAFVVLMNLAGRNPKTGEANPRALNRLPLDMYLAAAALLTYLGALCAYELLDVLFRNDGYNVLVIVLLCGCGIAVATTDVGFFTALAAQVKCPGAFWWKKSICGRVLQLAWKLLRMVWCCLGKVFHNWNRRIGRLFRMLPVIWQWLAAGGVLGFFLVIICAGCTAHWYSVIPLVLWCLVFTGLVTYCGYGYGVIQKGIKRMKDGDLNKKISTEWLFGPFKTIAEDLNALADVVSVAAEKQLKAERMKAELITNVSHDIKTPLTSVINYVDLLQQPHTEEEGEQYLEVLSRQSVRLKKLVEDLMDMSKASTGNVVVNAVPMDAVEAVNQALGEFADKLEAAELTPVFRPQMPQMTMTADGRLTWRVLSNLLSNVVKYALPGTRVYFDLTRQEKCVVLSVKNISREELNISAEELTERFVRGDVSRNTEGSGLGLNIAQSLMALQRGSLNITVDGDLFKVTLTFPTE